ncbi:MAG: hypothetical protein AAF587_24455 [Bacteroidota bacterium]
MKTLFLILTVTMCLITSIKSQISHENRIEFEEGDRFVGKKIFEFGKDGFIMRSINRNTTKKQNEWKFEKFDTDLKSVKTESVFLEKKMFIYASFVNEDRVQFLFQNLKGNFSIVTVESSHLEVTKIDGVLPKDATVNEMTVLGDYTFFRARKKNTKYLFSVNWKTGEKKLIPYEIGNISPMKTALMNFQVLENSNEVFLYAKVYIAKGKSDIFVIRLNSEGNKEGVFNLTKDIEENLVHVSALKLTEDKYIYTGTYSTEYTYLSEGLFFCQAKNDKVEFIEFYNFLDFENFLSYLPEKKIKKIKQKKENKEKKAKELIENYRISPHELIVIDDGIIFLGEAYYPAYSADGTSATGDSFIGNKYTHAIIGKFDENGKLLWDETFKISSLDSNPSLFDPKRYISITEKKQNSINMVFSKYNIIHSISIDYSGAILQDHQYDAIQSTYEGDKVLNSFSDVDYWYDNYFIVYGKQEIKNTNDTANSKRKREVYFINKIKFEKE